MQLLVSARREGQLNLGFSLIQALPQCVERIASRLPGFAVASGQKPEPQHLESAVSVSAETN
jgi:hypothetical protein